MNYEVLSGVAKVIMGQSPPSSTYNTVGEGLPFYQGKTDFGDMYPTPRVYCTEPSRIAEAGDILISVRAPVGPTNVSQERSCIGRGISAIRVGKNLDRDFLLYFLRFYEPELARAGTGSTFTAIAREDLESIKIPLLPPTEQKRIASLLARADRLRGLRQTAHDLGDALLQSVFLEMFGNPVTNSKKWYVESLEDVLASSPQNGLYVPEEQYESRDSENGVEMVHMSDAFYGRVERGSLKRVKISEKDIQKYSITHNDLLIARRSLNFEGAAKPCLIPVSDKPLVFESSMIRVTTDQSKILPIYLYYYFSNEKAKQAHILKYVTKSTISGINQDNLKQIEVITPPLSLQEEFAGVVARVEGMRSRQAESERQVSGLFESMLAQSFG
jgi:type I restriction enzyme S subunit